MQDLWKSTDFVAALLALTAPEDDLAFFRSTPWTSKILDDSNYKCLRLPSRDPKTPSTEDELFSKALKTTHTVAHALVLVRIEPEDAKSSQKAESNSTNPEVIVLLDLQAGLCGFQDTLHGGIACTLLDESLGICVELNRHRQTLREHGPSRDLPELYTATLNMSYKRPAMLPGVFMTRCWLEKNEGRKWYLKGQLCDGDGNVYNEADGLWISARSQKL